jgi:hypothetical protein
VGNMCLQLVVAKEVIFKLEQAQDHRSLSEEEIILRNELKMKCLGIASLNRTIVRQCSRLLFLHERLPVHIFSTFKPSIVVARVLLNTLSSATV